MNSTVRCVAVSSVETSRPAAPVVCAVTIDDVTASSSVSFEAQSLKQLTHIIIVHCTLSLSAIASDRAVTRGWRCRARTKEQQQNAKPN